MGLMIARSTFRQGHHESILRRDVVINSGSPDPVAGLAEAPDAGAINGDSRGHPARQPAIVKLAMAMAAG